jgi:hypothetical protein
MKRLPFIIALLCLVSTTLAAGSEHPLKARYNIDPTPEAIRAFLTTLDRSTMTRRQYASLLDQLGHESYDKREQASQSLRLAHQNGVYFADLMKQALKSPDAEIQIRAEMLVEHRKKLNPNEMATKTLIAALGVIDEEHFKGFTELLVSTAPRVHDEAAQLALIHTLSSVTDPTDVKAVATIGKAMTHESAAVRRMAAETMIGLLGSKANDRIAPLFGDDDPAVRFIAAKHLIETGDRRALRVLIDMAADPNATLQHNSIALLRAITGKQFGYDASKEPEANAESIQRWQAWHVEHGATAKLNAPLGADSVDSTGLVLHYVFKDDQLAKDRSGQGNDGSGKNVQTGRRQPARWWFESQRRRVVHHRAEQGIARNPRADHLGGVGQVRRMGQRALRPGRGVRHQERRSDVVDAGLRAGAGQERAARTICARQAEHR